MSDESCSQADREETETDGPLWKTASAVGHFASVGANDWSSMVLSSAAEILSLKGPANRLIQTENTMLSPEFFLASLSKGWGPKVVVVCRGPNVVGILYARERTFGGVPTGIVYADGSLSSIFLAEPLYHKPAFFAATEALLASPKIRSIRLRILHSSRDFDSVLQLTSSNSHEVQYFPIENLRPSFWKNHAHLPLPSTYDGFLKTLGSTTRHNFRYYRRRFEASGHSFVEHLSPDELRSAALRLLPKSKLTARSQGTWIDGHLKIMAAASRPLAVGLKHSSGEWLSVLGGWYMPAGAVLRFQCNNEKEFGQHSLSVVLRAYLIELLIRQGLKDLVIWADTGPPLSRYVTYAHTIYVRVDTTARSWRVARSIISAVEPLLPNRLAALAHWIVG